MPDQQTNLADTSADTCATFTSVSTRATKLRYATTCPNTTLNVTIRGENMGCGKNLYMSPISEAEQGSWTGKWGSCQLDQNQMDPQGKEWCSYSCTCPEIGCQEVQLVRKPMPGEDSTWSLCTLFSQCDGEHNRFRWCIVNV
jgi:hypothetical protein